MKTTAKLSLLAAAFLLMIAGCANNFTPTEPSKDSFAKNVENKNTGVKQPLKVAKISDAQKYSDGTGYRLTITFSKPVDVKSVEGAVHVRALTVLTQAGKPSYTSDLPLQWLADKKDVPLTEVSFKVVTQVPIKAYISIKGDEVRAFNLQQHMDQDTDGVQGESTDNYKGDDDYNEVKDIGDVSTTLYFGDEAYLYTTAGKATKISALLCKPAGTSKVSFVTGREVGNVNKTDTGANDLVTHIVVENSKEADGKYDSAKRFGVSNDVFGAFLNGDHVVVEQLTAEGWKTVDKTFTFLSLTDPSKDYTSHWVSKIEVNQNTKLRVRFAKVREIALKNGNYEYSLKYSTNAHISDANAMEFPIAVYNDSGNKVGFSATLDASKVLEAKKAADTDTITLTYTVPSEFKNAVYDNNKPNTVKLINKDDFIAGNYKGLDTTALDKEKFKLSKLCRVMTKYTSNSDYSYNGISARLSLNRVIRSKSLAMGISDITALGNSLKHSLTGKDYYADVTNTVTLAYNDVSSGLKLPTDDDKKSIYDGIYDDLSRLYYSASFLDKYKSSLLTESFFQKLKKDNKTKSEFEILSFIDKAVKDTLDNNKDMFTSNGSLRHTEDIGAMNLYLSPAIKTLSFNGTYKNSAGKDVECSIPAFSFGKVQADSDDQLLREGWAKISVTTATN